MSTEIEQIASEKESLLKMECLDMNINCPSESPTNKSIVPNFIISCNSNTSTDPPFVSNTSSFIVTKIYISTSLLLLNICTFPSIDPKINFDVVDSNILPTFRQLNVNFGEKDQSSCVEGLDMLQMGNCRDSHFKAIEFLCMNKHHYNKYYNAH